MSLSRVCLCGAPSHRAVFVQVRMISGHRFVRPALLNCIAPRCNVRCARLCAQQRRAYVAGPGVHAQLGSIRARVGQHTSTSSEALCDSSARLKIMLQRDLSVENLVHRPMAQPASQRVRWPDLSTQASTRGYQEVHYGSSCGLGETLLGRPGWAWAF